MKVELCKDSSKKIKVGDMVRKRESIDLFLIIKNIKNYSLLNIETMEVHHYVSNLEELIENNNLELVAISEDLKIVEER